MIRISLTDDEALALDALLSAQVLCPDTEEDQAIYRDVMVKVRNRYGFLAHEIGLRGLKQAGKLRPVKQ